MRRLLEDHRVYLPRPERFEAIDEPDDPGGLAHAFAYARRALQGDPVEGKGDVLTIDVEADHRAYAARVIGQARGWGRTEAQRGAIEAGGIDPAILAWACRWCVSLATLAREGFMVYERDGFGELQLVGLDADGGLIDASDSLERLRACSRAIERRGLAGLGFGLAASHGAPAASWSSSP